MFSNILILLIVAGMTLTFIVWSTIEKTNQRLMRTNLVTVRKVRIFRYKLKNKGYGYSRKYKSNMR
jgi:hypothetical protein